MDRRKRKMDDFIEFGKTGWVPIADGAFYNKRTHEYKAPDGKIFSSLQEMKEYRDGLKE
jgi:hypothetical protein